MKGKKKGQGKASGTSKQERKEAVRKKVQRAFSGEIEVEVIPANYDIEPEKPKILRVAAYCRVSTDMESQTESYELQVQYYENYIKNHPGWEYVDTFADEGISGTSVAKRKRFQEMIAACEEGKIDLIITKDIRRFARNTLDCLSYIRQLKKLEPPVGIYFEDEHLNTLDRGNDAMLALLSSVAQTSAHIPTVKGLEEWPPGSIYNILRNEKYCGDVINQKTITPDFLDHKVVKNRGQERKYIVRNHHPAIIERSDWDRVQAMLSDHTRRGGRKRKEKLTERLSIATVHKGRFKGYIVLDPKWKKKDLPRIQAVLETTNTEKE